jgi:hypothetical protein
MDRNLIKYLFSLLLVLGISTANAQTYNLFKPANGILKGQTSTYVTTAAASSDVRALWSGTCNASTFLRGDGACAAAGGGSANPQYDTVRIGVGTIITPGLTGSLVLKGPGVTADSNNALIQWDGDASFSLQFTDDAGNPQDTALSIQNTNGIIQGLTLSGKANSMVFDSTGMTLNSGSGLITSTAELDINDGGQQNLRLLSGSLVASDTLTGANSSLGPNGVLISTNLNTTAIPFEIANTNSGTSAQTWSVLQNDLGNAFLSIISSSTFSGSIIGGGPTGQSAALMTSVNFPLSIGTNNLQQMLLDPTTGIDLNVNTTLRYANPKLDYYSTSGTTNEHWWRTEVSSAGDTWRLAGVSDDGLTVFDVISAVRFHNSIIDINFAGPAVANDTFSMDADYGFGTQVSPSALTSGNNNDYNPGGSIGSRTYFRLTPDAAGSNITGFQSAATRTVKWVYNIGTTGNIVLKNEDSNSSAGNRILTPNASDYTLKPGSGVTIIYDGTSSRWRLQGVEQPSSGVFSCTTACTLSSFAVGNRATLTKTSNTSRSSTTTLAADPDLQASVASGQYAYHVYIDGAFGGGTQGIKLSIKSAGGSILPYMCTATTNTANPNTAPTSNDDSSLEMDLASVAAHASMKIVCDGFFSGGSIQFHWAQNSSSGTSSTVNAGSHIELVRMN